MLTPEKEAELRALTANNPDLLQQLLTSADQAQKAAQTAGAAFKSTDNPQEMVINGVTYRAVVKEAEPEAAVETPVTEPAAQPDLAALFQQAFAPIAEQIATLNSKVDGLTTTTQKETSDRATLITALDARLKELEGDQPTARYRASVHGPTPTTLKDAQPKNDFLDDFVNGMFGAPA